MNRSESEERQKNNHNAKGVATGIELALFFLVSFYFLQYPVPLVIIFSLIGGFAGGLIVAWWQDPYTIPPVEDDSVPKPYTYKTSIGKAQRQRAMREQNTPLGSFFGKRKPKKGKNNTQR